MRPTSTKCIQIDASLHAKLEQVKAQTGQTITHLITQAIQFFLSENIHICNTQASLSRPPSDGPRRGRPPKPALSAGLTADGLPRRITPTPMPATMPPPHPISPDLAGGVQTSQPETDNQ